MTDYSLIAILKRLHAWRRPIVYFTAGVAVVSIVVALVLPVYYQASTTFYAASEDLFMPKKVFGYSNNEMLYYGTTDDIQRILTIGRSHELTDHLVETFALHEHYGIDSDDSKARFRVREKFLDRYELIRTKYDAIELTVEDRNPEMASLLANAARDKVDELVSSVIKSSQERIIKSYRSSIEQKEQMLAAIYDSLSRYQLEYGIFDPEAQTEYLSTLITDIETRLTRERGRLRVYESSTARAMRDSVAYLRGVIGGLEEQHKMLTASDSVVTNYSIERFNKGKGYITVLDDAYKKATNAVNVEKELLKQQESVYALNTPAIHIVETAEPPLIKHRPKRSLLVVSATLAAFIFMCFGVLLIESYRHLDWDFLKKW
ncbi:MAG: hypothetical protein R3301_07655 [Saprospiraceae bacterium]|nr:hypothetical protein [Saprospiraceae bacterium]